MESIKEQAERAALELIEAAKLKKGDVVVVGCSSSEVNGYTIGKNSVPETADEIFEAINGVLKERGIFLAAQCCEHLNRCIITERAAASGYDIVNAVPQPKAGDLCCHTRHR